MVASWSAQHHHHSHDRRVKSAAAAAPLTPHAARELLGRRDALEDVHLPVLHRDRADRPDEPLLFQTLQDAAEEHGRELGLELQVSQPYGLGPA